MANESIEGKAYQLKDILATEFDCYYQIPIYQRPYQWTEENCKKLLDDLLSSYEYYKESDYFCGSLVLIAIGTDSETNATTYDVVDGQQRLSTFILLAKVLATLYNNEVLNNKTSKDFLEKSLGDTDGEKRKRLTFNTIGLNAKDDFQDALDFFDDLDASKGKNSKSNDPSKGKNNYLKNAICLKNYLKEKEIENINAFIKWLYLKVTFIKTTCPNISMALRIFSVLNARGLPLHAIDIFKAELLKKLANKKDQEEFVFRWNALRQKCSENESKFPKRKENKREKNAAEILFSWYLAYLNPVTGAKSMEERLADQFEKLNKPPLEYLKGIEDFYNAYCKVLEMQDWHAHLLSYLASDFWRIILCTSILHHYSDQDIEALKELLVKFYYQNWVAEQTEPKKQTNCNIIKALKEKQSVENIASIVKKYLDDDNNKITQNFREKLKDDHLYEKHKKASKNSWLRPILILVEYSMSDDPKPKRIQKDDYHIEHILPQNPDPSSQWVKDFSEEERGLYTHSLANLTLLGSNKNSQASNLDFKEKKEIYMGNAVKLGKDKRGREKPFKVMTCYKMTIDIAYKYTEWTPKNLEKRKEELIQKIESVLEL
ncbi:hypothetical protein BB472_07475 [Helicobacter pylori]|uniref:DUF262 domain-containing protein n=1 Tax=Helicobacter pylori TaxID=210 RepID=UPI000992BA90|nr:DUF262 domain-containing protein [Helicobacter pylori]MBM0607381.1 DUF262 domain-containing protein [Helicobacter pylori]OOQ27432.1 hypothetical protein B0X62_05640 [Helicobacter pylori]PDW62509.1 hypothetical protein BB444_00885 [Helicobacter pylori]PDX45452.1 hypothetical protein BB472_07475 [Helicobacter pylori]PDX55830.1 hypothetical protein BB481_00830 [Helicobacter pylori]